MTLPGERGGINAQVLKKIDASGYLELSCLTEGKRQIPGNQLLGGFKRKNRLGQ
jgi:hypothetical protein